MRILSIILAMVMAFTLAVPGMAAEPTAYSFAENEALPQWGNARVGGPIMKWETMVTEIYEMQALSPHNMKVYTVAEYLGPDRVTWGTSDERRPLHFMLLGNGNPDNRVIWAMAQVHGNERLATDGMMEWMWRYAKDPVYAKTLENLTIIAIPIYNPDGSVRSVRGADAYNDEGVRTATGVDLNNDWRMNMAGDGMGFRNQTTKSWYELWCKVLPEFGVDLHNTGTRTTNVPTGHRSAPFVGTGSRNITMSLLATLNIDGWDGVGDMPTLPPASNPANSVLARILGGTRNKETKQMISHVYESIKDDVRDMFYPEWATDEDPNRRLHYPIDLYGVANLVLDTFGCPASGMQLGISWNDLNPYNWSHPTFVIESEQQHNLAQLNALPLTQRWLSIAMQNYCALVVLCEAMATDAYKQVNDDDYYNIAHTGTRPNFSFDGGSIILPTPEYLKMMLDMSYLDPREMFGHERVAATVTQKSEPAEGYELTVKINRRWSGITAASPPGNFRLLVEKKFDIGEKTSAIYEVGDFRVYVATDDTTVLEAYIVDDGFILTTESFLIKASDYFTVDAAFAREIDGNAAIVTLDYDPKAFEYAVFTPAAGVELLHTVWDHEAGTVSLTVMKKDYALKNVGAVMFLAKAGVTNKFEPIEATVTYVVGKDGKVERVATGKLEIATYQPPDPLTIIHLSNIIDWFGIDSTHPDWRTKYVFWDFGGDRGMIDIFDIVYVAQRINSLITKAPETQTYRAVYLGGNEFFNESTYERGTQLPPNPTTVTTYKIAPAVGALEPGEVYDITVGNGAVLEAKLSQVAVRPRTPPTPLEGTIVSFSVSFVGMQFSLQLDTPVGTIGYIWGVSRHPGVKKGMFRITQMGDNATVEAVFEDVFDLTRGMWCGLNAGDYVKMYGTPAEQEYGPATHVDSIYIIDFDEEIKITATQNAV